MACKVPNAYRIGIDSDTLDYFELDIENVEEKYETPIKHLDALREDGEYHGGKEMIDYLEDKRIEINSVIAELDNNARFWVWIIEKLREQFPTRDYTRSVNIPEYVIPGSLQLFNDKVKEKGIAVAKVRLDKLQDNLSNISGFLFDRTNGVLQNGKQITIEKYDQIVAVVLTTCSCTYGGCN